MIKAKYATALCLVLTLILLTFIAGCSGSTTTTNATSSTTKTTSTTTSTSAFTQEQLKQIMLDAKTAMVKAGTYKINMDLMRKTAFDDKAASAGMSMSANFTFNVPQNQLMMSFNMTNTNPDSGEATLEAEIYVFTDYIYMKLNIPGLGIQWVKTPVNAELLDTFNTNMMKEELDGMELPASIEFIKYENIRGTDCYVLKYTPAESYFRDYAEKNVIDGLKIDWDKVSNISDMFKDMSFTTWIGKDTKYIYKMEISGAVVVSSDFAELAGVSFKKATTDIEQTMEIYDINAAASIVLPAEAENAIELSPEMILGK